VKRMRASDTPRLEAIRRATIEAIRIGRIIRTGMLISEIISSRIQ